MKKKTIGVVVVVGLLFYSGSLRSQEVVRSLEPVGFVEGRFQFRVNGPVGGVRRVEVSTNFVNWETVARIDPFTGSHLFTEDTAGRYRMAFYRSRVEASGTNDVFYGGDSLVLVANVPPAYGPGSVVHFEVNGVDVQVTADATGLYTIVLDLGLVGTSVVIPSFIVSADGIRSEPLASLRAIRQPGEALAFAVPTNLAVGGGEPNICTCVECTSSSPLELSSAGSLTTSLEARASGVFLFSGRIDTRIPIVAHSTRRNGFDFYLIHASLRAYNGPFGQSVSHSFKAAVVQTGPRDGIFVTRTCADMRLGRLTVYRGNCQKDFLPPLRSIQTSIVGP